VEKLDLGLKGKVAAVTGASKGIGRAIAIALAKEGVHIAACARNEAPLMALGREIEALGVRAFVQPADVTHEGQMKAFIEGVAASLGPPLLLVVNAGGTLGGRFFETSEEDWRGTFDVNLFHAVRAIQAVVPFMQKERTGSIVVISSVSGVRPGSRVQYAAAKAAQNALVKGLVWELAPFGVRINAVLPGSIYFEGGNWAKLKDQSADVFEGFQDREFPFKRLGTPEEVAQVVAFILSEKASWVNGALIAVDGGQGWPSVSLRGR
jgi:3-oxoacyl-[acyl-carrier protein] reductase